MAFCVLSICQLFHAFDCRNWKKSLLSIGFFSNRGLVGALVVGLLLQCSLVLFAPLAAFFKVQVLGSLDWLIVFGLAVSPIILNELAKLVRRLSAH
jgi:Ca2+-transporting ATPase